MLELTHVHVLFRNSHFAHGFNFNVNEPVRIEVKVFVDFAPALLNYTSPTLKIYYSPKYEICLYLYIHI